MNQKQYKRYLPKLIKDKLDTLDHPRKDNLYTIIDLINRKEIYYKTELQKTYGYTEISLKQFKKVITSSDNLNEDIKFLVEKELIIRNDFYTMGYTSKGYKIPTEYLGERVGVLITNKNINKRISKQIQAYKRLKVKSLEFAKTDYYKTFKLNYEGAKKAIMDKAVSEIKALCIKVKLQLLDSQIHDIIDCTNDYKINRANILYRKDGAELNNILHRFMIYSTRLDAIHDGFLFFKRNKTNGRLDSNLTSLPSFLRPFIISTERLMSVDIKNSQPYFLYTQIKGNPDIDKKELDLYTELVVSGRLYEYLMEKHQEFTGYERTRDQMKTMLCKIYYSQNSTFQGYKAFFGSIFPTIMKYINTAKSIEHNVLANTLCSIESKTVLDVVMPLLEQKGIRPYTIHDSFLCKESEADTIEEIFNTKLTEMYGVAPKLKIEFINEMEEDVDIELDDPDDEVLLWGCLDEAKEISKSENISLGMAFKSIINRIKGAELAGPILP